MVGHCFCMGSIYVNVEKTQFVDKTKEIVYNVFNNVKEKVNE